MMRHLVELSAKTRKFAADTSGATAIKYGLIAAGIAIAIIVYVGLVGDELAAMFQEVRNEIAPTGASSDLL